VYDEFGAPVFGKSTRLPTYDVPDYDYGGFRSFGSSSQPSMTLPPVYNTPSGSIGSRQVAQPYNTSSMYTNIMPPQGYAGGGQVQYFDDGGPASSDNPPSPNDDKPAVKTPEQLAAERQAALETMRAQQKAGRDIANQRRAERRAGGSGQMYNNINAGLAALAPEQFPGAPVQLAADREAAMRGAFSQAKAVSDIDYARVMQQQGYRPEEVAALTGRSFGDINRRYRTALRQDAAAPMLQGQRNAMAEQARILGTAPGQVNMTPPAGDDGIYRTQSLATQPPVTQPPVTQPPVTQPPVTQPPVGAASTTGFGTPVPKITHNQIIDYLGANPGMTDAQIRQKMDQSGVNTVQMAAATGLPLDQVQQRYNSPSNFSNEAVQSYLAARPGLNDAQIRSAMNEFKVTPAQVAAATGVPFEQVQSRYNYAGSALPTTSDKFLSIATPEARGGYTNQQITDYLAANPNMTDSQLRTVMDLRGVGVGQMAAATGLPMDQVQSRYNSAFAAFDNKQPVRAMNMGGIAGLAAGGYPRRTGQISGPGSEKSVDIPAILSDGEFVMTAKAVRGAGKGSRRAGAKQM
jgi:uncharacterized protein YneF (UPF0154 family)